jgi:hypothetical protein
MTSRDCTLERIEDLIAGIGFLFIGGFLLAMGVTFLPVLGIVLAIPVIGFALSFFAAPLDQNCSAI